MLVHPPPPFQPALGSDPCLGGLSLEEQSLGSAPLALITNTLCSQELLLSNDLLGFYQQPWEFFSFPECHNIPALTLSQQAAGPQCGQGETLLWLQPIPWGPVSSSPKGDPWSSPGPSSAEQKLPGPGASPSWDLSRLLPSGDPRTPAAPGPIPQGSRPKPWHGSNHM